ncbi:hypothetical protein P0Y35_16060 [Kiritimatiellaeota bacterium B1221]|nr:hypothetical protein [Kiritimatiellaeota bacterium B1221]
MAETFLTSLLLHPQGCEMTQWSDDKSGEPVFARTEGEPPAALKTLCAKHPPNGKIESALPAGKVMMMVLTLPATTESEIDGMVQLQAEEISPFPPERTCVSWEKLEEKAPRTKVLMALTSRKELDGLQARLSPLNCSPQRVDVDVLGWLELLQSDEFLTSENDALILILQGENSYVVAWHKGHPCLIRSMLQARSFSVQTLREELSMLSMSLESEAEPAGNQELQIWFDGEAPHWSATPVDGWTFDLHSLDQLPPLTRGLARRGAKGARMDLSPLTWKEEAAKQTAQKKMLRTILCAGSAWLVLMLSFLGWAQYRQSGLRSIQKENRLNASAVADVQDLAAQVRSLTQFTDRSSSALETMLMLAKATPGSGNLVIEDYRYEKEEGITFSGTTSGDVQPFYQFLEDLSSAEQLRVKGYDLKEAKRGFSFQVEAVWSWIQEADGEVNP